MSLTNIEHGNFGVLDIRAMPIERAEFLIEAANNFGVTAVQKARERQPYQAGTIVTRVKVGEMAVLCLGEGQAITELNDFVDSELGPEELPTVEV